MQELRGVWIPNVNHSNFLSSKENIDKGIKNLKQWGFNTIFPVVWNQGFTLYKSEIMKSLFGVDMDPSRVEFENRDPLKEVIEIAHKAGIVVIPWFEYGFACSAKPDGGHILAKKPNWGPPKRVEPITYMNSLNSEVQRFIEDLAEEVVKNYDVDGIQFDDHFAFPAKDLSESKKVEGAKSLTACLSRLVSKVKAIKPNAIISMSPNPYPWCLVNYLQDSKTWADMNLVDLFCTQLYRPDITSYREETQKIKNDFSNHLKKYAPGLAFKVHEKNLNYDLISQCILENRNSGFSGHVFFMYEGLFNRSDSDNADSPQMHSQLNENEFQGGVSEFPTFVA